MEQKDRWSTLINTLLHKKIQYLTHLTKHHTPTHTKPVINTIQHALFVSPRLPGQTPLNPPPSNVFPPWKQTPPHIPKVFFSECHKSVVRLIHVHVLNSSEFDITLTALSALSRQRTSIRPWRRKSSKETSSLPSFCKVSFQIILISLFEGQLRNSLFYIYMYIFKKFFSTKGPNIAYSQIHESGWIIVL